MVKPQLPNDIIMRIIREAEIGYGGSHWRQHRPKYRQVLLDIGEPKNPCRICKDVECLRGSDIREACCDGKCEECYDNYDEETGEWINV